MKHLSLKNNLNRRDFLLDTLLMSGMAGLSLPLWADSLVNMSVTSSESENKEPPPLKIGYLPIADATALLVADAYGYFAEQGLNVTSLTKVSSWAQLVRGFFTQQFNLVHFLKPIPIWLRYNHRVPIKIMLWAHINGSAIVVGKHLKIQSVIDLAGKQIAVPYWYSMHNILLQMVLRNVGLKPVIKNKDEPLAANEVNLRLLPPPIMPEALIAKAIDAYIVAEPLNAKGEIVAGAKILRFTGDIWKNHPCCVICMNESLVTHYPVWTQKIVNALVQAQIYAQNNKEEVAYTLSLAGKQYIPAPEPILKRAILKYDVDTYGSAILHANDWHNGRIDFSPWPYPSATRLLVEAMKQTLVTSDATFLQQLEPAFVVDDLVDYHFVKIAMENYQGWKNGLDIDIDNPFQREEVIVF
jgi:NitT/TauT family transport system substrate-binding protein